MESPAVAGIAADRRPTTSTTADAPPWLAAVVDAAAVCKRGLAANQVLDIKQPDLHVVVAVLLAASVDVAEDMRQLYAVCDVLLDAHEKTMPNSHQGHSLCCYEWLTTMKPQGSHVDKRT